MTSAHATRQEPVHANDLPGEQHYITECLLDDIRRRYGVFARRFTKKPLELHILPEGWHLENEDLHATECRVSHVDIPRSNAEKREYVRAMIESCLCRAICENKLAFSAVEVTVRTVSVFGFDERDHYGTMPALHVKLTR